MANGQLAFCICDEGIINSWVFPPMLIPQMRDKRAVQNTMACCYPFVMVGPRQRPRGSLMRVGSPPKAPRVGCSMAGVGGLSHQHNTGPMAGGSVLVRQIP